MRLILRPRRTPAAFVGPGLLAGAGVTGHAHATGTPPGAVAAAVVAVQAALQAL